MTKRIASLLMTLALTLTMCATAIAVGDVTEITVWTWYSEQLKQSVVPAFEEKYPDIKVNALTLDSGDLHVKLLACLASGTGAPDATGMQGDEIKKFIAFGGLLDLTDRIAPYVDDFPKYKIANDTDVDGRIYGVPIDCGPWALFINKTAYEKAGIDYKEIKTWDDYLAGAELLKEAGYYLTRMSKNGDADFVRAWVHQQGQGYLTEDGKANFDTEAMINALTLMKKFYDSGCCFDSGWWDAAYAEAVMGQQIASMPGPAWTMNVFIHSYPTATNWEIINLPQWGPDQDVSANLGGSEFVIPEQSEKQDAAWKFIEFYLCDRDTRQIGMESLGEFPALLSIYDSEYVMNKTEPFFGDEKVYSFFAQQLTKVPAFPMTAAFAEVSALVSNVLPLVISGDLTPQEAAEKLQSEGEAVVANY